MKQKGVNLPQSLYSVPQLPLLKLRCIPECCSLYQLCFIRGQEYNKLETIRSDTFIFFLNFILIWLKIVKYLKSLVGFRSPLTYLETLRSDVSQCVFSFCSPEGLEFLDILYFNNLFVKYLIEFRRLNRFQRLSGLHCFHRNKVYLYRYLFKGLFIYSCLL